MTDSQPRYAGFRIRALAYLIDMLVMTPFAFLGSIAFQQHNIVLYFVAHLAFPLYKPWMEAKQGGTIGKQICKIRVQDYNGKNITVEAAYIRFAPLLLHSVLSLAMCYMLFDNPSFTGNVTLEQRSRVIRTNPFDSLRKVAALMVFVDYLFIFVYRKRRMTIHDLMAQSVCVHLTDVNISKQSQSLPPTGHDRGSAGAAVAPAADDRAGHLRRLSGHGQPLTDSASRIMPLLEINNLVTAFHTPAGRVPAVDGVSLSIERGRTLGLVGESGCGKSVTAMSVLRLVAAPGTIEAGEILLEDTRAGGVLNLVTLPEPQLREVRGGRIGMIFQEPMTSLNPVFTIGDQIAEAVLLHRRVSREAARARALEMLELVRMADPQRRLDEYPHQLSGGMRQRVMIAMALACEPDLIIADEPTTALDVTIQAQILDLLADLRRRLGTAILLITHDLGVVAETCDDVAVMYAGRIVEQAPAARLFAQPRHPYTIGLLAARPGGTGRRGTGRDRVPLRTIPGMVPAPQHFPSGCRFHPRCGYARLPECGAAMPELREVAPGHFVRCGYAEDLGPPRPDDQMLGAG